MTVVLRKDGVGIAVGDVSAPDANVVASITYPAPGTGLYNVLTGVAWSYDGVPAGGRLQIYDGATSIFDLDVTAQGVDSVSFAPPKVGSHNTAMTITLSAGGVGVSGKLSILGRWVG